MSQEEKMRRVPCEVNFRVLSATGSATALLSGLAYYVLFRPDSLLLLAGWSQFGWIGSLPDDPTAGTLPSLTHSLGMTLLAIALFGHRQQLVVSSSIGALLITLIAERYVGTFDPGDALMALVGCGLPLAGYLRYVSGEHYTRRFRDWLGVSVILGLSVAGITGTSVYCGDDDSRSCINEPNAQPVYLNYDELRSAVNIGEPRELSSIGRLYLYRNLILLNERNQGVHVIDNTDPTNPVNRAFIEIPGSTELSIRNDMLYADSYIDLVTIDLSARFAVREVDREIGVFPFDPYQNVPDGILFNEQDIDPALGVIVDYR